MSKMFHCMLIFSFFIISCNAAAFDFYKFSLQWPPSACMFSTETCLSTSIHDTNFRVHGMWPTNYTGEPRECTPAGRTKPTPMISRNAIPGNLKVELDLFWPNLFSNGDNFKFWSTQWKNHGTCSHEDLNPLNYLNYVNNIRKRTNLSPILSAAKIIPDNTNGYEVALLNATIYNSHLKAVPELTCKLDKKSNELYLFEIRLCFPNTGKLNEPLIDCKPTKSCGTEFKLPK